MAVVTKHSVHDGASDLATVSFCEGSLLSVKKQAAVLAQSAMTDTMSVKRDICAGMQQLQLTQVQLAVPQQKRHAATTSLSVFGFEFAVVCSISILADLPKHLMRSVP